MIEVKCPLCGSRLRSASERRHTRLHCRKCHTPLHLERDRKVVIGDPPDVEQDLEEWKQALRDLRGRIPVRRILTTAAAILAVWVPASYLLGPSRGLAKVAEAAARAVAENDPGYIESIAAPGTSEDVTRWFEQAHRQLVEQRRHWYAKSEQIEVHVASEDPSKGKGVVGISIHPAAGNARDVTLADPEAATAAAPSPCNLETVWTKDWLGRWMLDGRDTGARGPAAPSVSPVESRP